MPSLSILLFSFRKLTPPNGLTNQDRIPLPPVLRKKLNMKLLSDKNKKHKHASKLRFWIDYSKISRWIKLKFAEIVILPPTNILKFHNVIITG